MTPAQAQTHPLHMQQQARRRTLFQSAVPALTHPLTQEPAHLQSPQLHLLQSLAQVRTLQQVRPQLFKQALHQGSNQVHLAPAQHHLQATIALCPVLPAQFKSYPCEVAALCAEPSRAAAVATNERFWHHCQVSKTPVGCTISTAWVAWL